LKEVSCALIKNAVKIVKYYQSIYQNVFKIHLFYAKQQIHLNIYILRGVVHPKVKMIP